MTDATLGAAADPRSGRLARFLLAAAIVAPVAALYVAFPAANYTDAKDSLSYALRIREGAPLLHANHLLYEPVNFLLHRLTVMLAGPVDPLRVMQLFSTVTAIPALLLVCRLAQRWSADPLPGLLAVGAVGLSFGVWCYAISPDGYLPPLFLALLTLAMIDPARLRRFGSTAPPSMRVVAAAALATAGAALLHQMYVFFGVIVGVAMALSPAFGDLRGRMGRFLLYGSLSGGIVLAAYVVAFLAVAPLEASFLDWARGYAGDKLYWGDPPSLLTPVRGVIGAVSTMLSMNGLFAFEPVADALMAQYAHKSLVEERFIAETAIGPMRGAVVIAAMAAAVAAWLAMAAGALSALRAPDRAPPAFLSRLLLALTLVYAALVLAWEPMNREFWIHVYVFATLWCARTIDLRRVRAQAAGAILCLSLFAANFLGAILPLSSAQSDYWRMRHAEDLAGIEGYDAVLVSCNFLCESYLRYFHAPDVIAPKLESLDVFERRLAEVDPDRLLVSRWFLSPHETYIDPRTRQPATPERYAAVREIFARRFPEAGDPPPDAATAFRFVDGRLVPARDAAP